MLVVLSPGSKAARNPIMAVGLQLNSCSLTDVTIGNFCKLTRYITCRLRQGLKRLIPLQNIYTIIGRRGILLAAHCIILKIAKDSRYIARGSHVKTLRALSRELTYAM